MAGLPGSSPGSFVNTRAPACGPSLPQKPVELVNIIDDMNCDGPTSQVSTQDPLEHVFRIKPSLWRIRFK
jgi:hypothetical protein